LTFYNSNWDRSLASNRALISTPYRGKPVADSQTERLEANVEAARDMAENLHILGFDPQTMPLVLQCNKRDLPGVAPVPLIKRQFGFTGVPCLESVATQGNGVFDTLKTIINLVVAQAQRQL